MKGFAKIFEAIVASVILLASLTFFFTPNVQESGWDSASLQILAQDALKSAYLNGTLARYVKTDDTSQLNSFFSDMLPKTVDFSIEVRGIPGKTINIVCADCTQAQLDDLSAILNPRDFSYKMKNTSIRIEFLNLGAQNIPEGANILFFFDKTKIAAYQTKINDFLAAGGGVFLFSSLDSTDLINTPINRTFGLSWSGSTANPQGNFYNIYDPGNVTHYVARYYANISTRHLQNVQDEAFSVFSPTSVQAETDGRTVVGGGDKAYVRANELGKGRTVWMNDYTRNDHNNPNTKKIDNLTKAGVMWASGERSKLDIIKKTPAPVNFKSSIFVYDGDNYVVELMIWRIFF